MVRRGRGPAGEGVSEREHGSGAGGVVVGAVVDGVAGRVGGADAEVIEVRGEQDDLRRRDRLPRRMAMAFQVAVRGVSSNWERRWRRDGDKGEGSATFCRKLPLSPPGARPRARNCAAAKSAAMCSSRVAEPRPCNSSSARKAMSAWTSRSSSAGEGAVCAEGESNV